MLFSGGIEQHAVFWEYRNVRLEKIGKRVYGHQKGVMMLNQWPVTIRNKVKHCEALWLIQQESVVL